MKRKIKKLRTSDAGEIYLKQTDFFENAKFISGLPNGCFLFEKKGFFCMSLCKTAFFAFQSKKLRVHELVELNYVEGI